jgi:hypothetical protein
MARSAVGVGPVREATIRLERADAGDGRRARLRFVSVTVPEEPPERIGIAIRRDDTAAPWLGPHGWQPAEHLFEPEEVWLEGDDLVLTVGPPVVDGISPSTVVDVQLVDLDLRGSVTWANLPGRPPLAPPPVEPAGPPEPPAPPPVVGEGPAPGSVAPGAGKFAFRATPERRIALEPIDGSLDGGSSSLAPGEAIGSLRFTELAQAFSGELEVAGDGEARITSRSPEGAPVHVHFRVEPDGRVILHRPTGALDEPALLAEMAPGGSHVFGLPRGQLEDARQGSLILDAATLEAKLGGTREPPPAPWWRRGSGRSMTAALAAVVALAAVAAGYALVPWEPATTGSPAETQPTAPPPTRQADRTPPATSDHLEPPTSTEQAPPPARAEPLPPALEAPEPEATADAPSDDGSAAPAVALPLPPPPTPEPPTAEPPALAQPAPAPPTPEPPTLEPPALAQPAPAPPTPEPPTPEPPALTERAPAQVVQPEPAPEPPPADMAVAPRATPEPAPEPPVAAQPAPEPEPPALAEGAPAQVVQPEPAPEPPVPAQPAPEPEPAALAERAPEPPAPTLPAPEPPLAAQPAPQPEPPALAERAPTQLVPPDPAPEPPAVALVPPGPAAPAGQLLPAGRDSGHKLLAQLAATASSEDCANRQLPFFRVVDSDVYPMRLSPGGRVSHRLVYALCPAGSGGEATATITRELRGNGAVLLADRVEAFRLRPGTWASDEELQVPPNAVAGRYVVNTTVTVGDRTWTEQTDLLIE